MRTARVVIIDSGICNLFNVQRAFASAGAEVTVTRNARDIFDAPALVLPGVGAFKPGIDALEQHDLIEPILRFAKSGKPLLGICLGMQMLLTESEEHGRWNGLGLIAGRVRALKPDPTLASTHKIPHIGWNSVEPARAAQSRPWDATVLEGVEPGTHMYFVHSYVADPDDARCCLARTSYGGEQFCSVLNWENVSACQFHPERSGPPGLQVLNRFVTNAALTRS